MDFEVAIFDLDGTLLDSMDIWEQIDILFLQKRNLEICPGYVEAICARSFEEAAQYTIDLFGLSENVNDIVKEWNSMAAYKYAHSVKLYPYALDYLLRLKTMNVKLAVATGLPKQLFIPCLENNSILELFDVLCSTEEVSHGKEYPDIYEFVANKLEIAPSKCIVFDDVLPAIKSAKQAGMIACGMFEKYSEHHRAEIENIADYYVLNFKDAPLPYI